VLHSHAVEADDIWRMASARRAPIENWIQLAIDRMATTGYETIFWLDRNRAHDAQLLAYVEPALAAAGLTGKVSIMAPREATTRSFELIYKGENTIAVTGNVLRDYLTDLFPILEVGTSAKMLSVVKLMEGGGLFETGAGGSAPKHVEQLVEENHLRWDSLGEFCALGESLRFLAVTQNKAAAKLMGDAVDTATEKLLSEGHSPQRKVGQPDNRNSHYWFARFWAEALADQSEDASIATALAPLAKGLVDHEADILAEHAAAAGNSVDLEGYYHPSQAKAAAAMRPSKTLNGLIG
jgi:isocitrate dehydrogenase